MIDLTEDLPTTITLIASPHLWKSRAVEEVTIDRATSCLRRRSLQSAPLRELIDLTGHASQSTARVALPITSVPRGPLLDFSVEGPLGPGLLLPRTAIAEREALYLESLAEEFGEPVSPELHQLLVEILGYTGEAFRDNDLVPLDRYLESGIGDTVAPPTIAEWRAVGEVSRTALRPYLDEFKGYSAPESPALAIPGYLAQDTARGIDDATEVLGQYGDLIEEAARAAVVGSPSAAADFLNVLADYGNHYELITAVEIPLDEPFLVKYSERRVIHLTQWTGRGHLDLVVADARTNHVTIKVSDPSVHLHSLSLEALGEDGTVRGVFPPQRDEQSGSIYAHENNRDFRVRLKFDLSVLLRLQVVPIAVSVLSVMIALAIAVEDLHDLKDLALVVGPVALAASILSTRESSTLGSRLRLGTSTMLASSVLVLIVTASWLFISGRMS